MNRQLQKKIMTTKVLSAGYNLINETYFNLDKMCRN